MGIDIIALTVVILVACVVGLQFILAFVNVCDPHELLVYSGSGQTLTESGRASTYRIEFGGITLRKPIIERVDRMDLRLMPIAIKVENAYSEGGIPLTIHAIANVKVSSDPAVVRNAVERFLRMPRTEIERVCKETMEGNLRGVVAKMTPEEVNHDRIKFAENIKNEVHQDLEKMGLVVDTLKIQTVHDNVDYMKSIGRPVIAQAHKEAEVAESDAKRAAAQAEAAAEAHIRIAEQKADTAIKQRQNELERLKNELEGRVNSEFERTEAAGREARAQAERKLQEVRTQLESLRLQADVVLPAQAQQEAQALLAAGQAALISEKGRATAAVVDMLNQVLADAGQEGMDIFILQKIDSILEQLVKSVERVRVGSVSLVDSGDGATLPAFVSSYPAMVGALMHQLKDVIGLDVAGALKQRAGRLQCAAGPPQQAAARESEQAAPVPQLGAAPAETDLTPREVLSLMVSELARERRVGEMEQKVFHSAARLLRINDAERDQIVADILS
ncbi:MAG: hypothetical protein HY815_04120, partial [Candidatus Riflebacteria bacterium]|nr:hypothetical protein [Candidatus Riflebacteria bacterium]